MGKKARAKVRAMSAPVAERHGFTSDGMLGHAAGDYAVNVNERIAIGVDVVMACTRIISDLVADADVGEYRGDERLEDSRLVRAPMATVTRRTWIWQIVSTMVLYNGSYVRGDLAGDDSEGVPLSLVPIAPPRVSWDDRESPRIDGLRVPVQRLYWLPRMTLPTIDRETAWTIRLAREAIAAAASAEAYRADFWEKGGAPTTIIKSDQALTNTEADTIRDRWVEARTANPGSPAVMGKGSDARLFGADVATKGAADAAERLGTSIARALGVPAWLANVPSAAGSMTYSNAASAGLDLVRYTLRPGYAGPIGDFLSQLLPGNYLTGRRVVLSLDHLTHGTMLERFQAYAIATQGQGWMRPGEVRTELHMPLDPSFDLDPAGAPAPAMEAIPDATLA